MVKDIRKTLRFSQKEYEKINQELQNANVTFSDFARSAILKKKIILPIEKDLLYELNKIGNNLNQIARAINSNEKIEVLKMLVNIENKLSELMKWLLNILEGEKARAVQSSIY